MKKSPWVVLIAGLVLTGQLFAQSPEPPPPQPAPPAAPAPPGNPPFTQPELDQMLAPVALYPDPLLAQVLMAATYPLEIVQAARWSAANPNLQGDAAVAAVSDQNWAPGVKSLVAFPQILQTMDQRIDWTERLGDAFLGQQSQVMDTVQILRMKSQQAGYLNTNAEVTVAQSPQEGITIQPADPAVVYVPYYSPTVVYGPWWWPGYPPVYWGPWAGYGWNGGFAWGLGIGVGVGFFFGAWDWHHHICYARGPERGPGGPWQHEAMHRRGVPYRTASLNRQFGRPGSPPASRGEYRGHTPGGAPRAPGVGGHGLTAGLAGGRPSAFRSGPGERGGGPANAQPRAQEAAVNARGGGGEARGMSFGEAAHRAPESRPHAFENIGHGPEVRNFSARGSAGLGGHPGAPGGPQPGGGHAGGGHEGGHGAHR